jgi:hypothetical protein
MSASFFLHQLIGGERPAELLALQHVLAGRVPAALGRAERAPGDAVARGVEAGEGPLEPRDAGQQILLRHEHIVHDDLTGGRCAQSRPCRGAPGADRPFQPFSRMKPRITPSSVLAQTTNTSRSGLLVIQVFARQAIAAGSRRARA